MASATYEEILRGALQLEPSEQRRLLDDLTALVAPQPVDAPRPSILELRGLGKELWRAIDSTQYLEQERNAWDG